MKHFGQHENCFGCKLRTIQFGKIDPAPQTIFERKMEKDMPAYQRMRRQGYQPKAVKGCAELETRAHSQFEIDHHKLVEPTLWKKTKNCIEDAQHLVQDGMRRARDMGVTVEDVKKWRKNASSS